MIKLRKEIISNSNTFREFKIIKSEIIHQLVEYESDFRQLSTIIKSVTSQNLVQKENAEIATMQLERLEIKVKILEKENFQILETNQELQRRLGSVTYSNCDKDTYINDLLTKISYLENIIQDYQKKYEVFILSPETFEHNVPKGTNNYFRKFNEFSRTLTSNNFNNNSSSNYKKDLNLNYDYNRDYLGLNNNFDIRDAMNYSAVNLRPRSSNYLKESNLTSKFEGESRNNNYLNRSIANNLNEDAKFDSRSRFYVEANKNINYVNNDYKSSVLSVYTPFEKTSINNYYQYKNNEFSNNKKESADEEARNSNLSKLNKERESDNINNNNSNDNYSNNLVDFSKSNGAPFKKATEPLLINRSENIENKPKILFNEKDKANLVSEILLKVFSSDSINSTLKRKYGEDFQFKLTDKNVDNLFLLEVEKDMKVLIKKEKAENKPSGNKNENLNYKELRKSLRTYSPEGKYIDPNNAYFKKKILEMTKNSKNNNSNSTQNNLSELMKGSAGFVNSCKSVEKKNNEEREISNSNKVMAFDLIKASANNQGESGGRYTSLKDYFINNSNFVKNLDRKQRSPIKLNKSGSSRLNKIV